MPSRAAAGLEPRPLGPVADDDELELGDDRRRGLEQRVHVLDRMQPAHEHADEAVRREPELLAQARPVLCRRGAVHPRSTPFGSVKMRSAGHAPRQQLLPRLGAQRGEPPHRNSSRALTAPSGLRARRARSPQSPVPEHGDQARQAEQARAQRDRARRQRTVGMNEVDLGTAPEEVGQCAGDVDDRGERRFPADRRAVHDRARRPARCAASPRTPASGPRCEPRARRDEAGAARAAARLRRSTAGRSGSQAPRTAPSRRACRPWRSSGLTGPCDRPPSAARRLQPPLP